MLPLGTSFSTSTLFAYLLLILIIIWLIINTSQNESGSDYGNDVFTEFVSEKFYSTTLKATNKTLFVAERAHNVRTCHGEVLKVFKQNLSRRIQVAKNVSQSKQKPNLRELYLPKIGI